MLPDLFPLGPFLVGEDGRLSIRQEGGQPSFNFVWRGRRFAARLEQGTMGLTGLVGRVPSSAAGRERREAAQQALRRLPALLPPGWALRLKPDHRILLEAREAIDWPANVAALLQPVVRFLLELGPYLDVLEECQLG